MLASIVTRAGALALVPFYSRAMTPDAYGNYALALTILSLGPVFALGLPSALSKAFFDTKDPIEAKERYGGVGKLLILVVSLVALIAYAALMLMPDSYGPLSSHHNGTCIVAATWGSTILTIPAQYGRDIQRPLLTALVQFAEFLLTFGFGLYLTFFRGLGLGGALEALAIAYALVGIATVVFTWTVLQGKVPLSLSTSAFRFSLPYVPHFLAVWAQGVAERWILKAAGYEASLGPYSVASQLSSPVNMLVASWNLERAATTGQTYRDEGRSGLIADLPATTRSYLYVSALPSLITLCGLPTLPYILGHRFVDATHFIPFMLLAIVIEACYCPAYQAAYYLGYSTRIAFATVTAAIVALAVGGLLIPTLGVWGAIAARITSALVRTGVMWYIAWIALRKTNLNR